VRFGIRACSIGKREPQGFPWALLDGWSVIRHKQHEAKHNEAKADDEDGHAC
jgi:hypothetical protein